MARMLSASLIHIRSELFTSWAPNRPPQAKVIEAVDHFLAFFLSLLARKDVAEPDQRSRQDGHETENDKKQSAVAEVCA
jgi:hypothetical protein